MLARRPQSEAATDVIAMPETEDLALSLAGVDPAFATSALTASAEGASMGSHRAVACNTACRDWVLRGHLTARAMMNPADHELQVCFRARHHVSPDSVGCDPAGAVAAWTVGCLSSVAYMAVDHACTLLC